MTSNRTCAAVAAGVLAATAFGLVPAPANAAEERPSRPQGKERCAGAIDRRLTTLAQLAEQARGNGPLTDAHESIVLSTTASHIQGFTGLRAEVQGASTAAALAEACRKVVPDYRVYVLTRPKVHLAIGADSLAAATARLDGAVARLQQAADAAEAAGRDVTAAQAEIDAAAAGAAAARDLAAGIPAAVLALEPAGYPANASVLASSRAALTDGKGKVTAAVRDAKDAKDLLRP